MATGTLAPASPAAVVAAAPVVTVAWMNWHASRSRVRRPQCIPPESQHRFITKSLSRHLVASCFKLFSAPSSLAVQVYPCNGLEPRAAERMAFVTTVTV
eukprot:3560448-Rhodomonas_salina.2